ARHLLLVPLVWYAVALIISYVAIRRMVDPLAAFFVTALFASTPAIAAAGMALLPDLIEFGFILAGMFIFLSASKQPLSPYALCACGICIGLGWLTRETSGAAVLFLLLSFIFRPLFDRRSYLIIGATAFICVAGETVWLAYSTGDILYRAHVDMR